MPCKSMMNFQKERGVSMHFPITHLNSPSIFETSSGMLGSVIHIKGVPFDTEDHEVLNQYKQSWHRALIGMGDEFGVMVTTHRRKTNVELMGDFKQPLLKEIDERYHDRFRNRAAYVNDIYLTVMTRGMTSHSFPLLSSVSNRALEKSQQQWRAEQNEKLDGAVQQLKTSLRSFSPLLLGSRDHEVGSSELLQFLSRFVNGGKSLRFRFPKWTGAMSHSINKCAEDYSLYPYGRIGSYISNHRLFFGDAIEFYSGEDRSFLYAAMVSVKRYATKTHCKMMDPLLQVNGEYLSTHAFYPEKNDVVQRLIGRHRRKLENVSDPAVSQINALSVAQDQLASDRMMMGYHHHNLMVFGNNLEALDQSVSEVIKCYADAGFVALRENIGQEPAFWSQIPGNTKMIARSALVTSENFVDFCPLHNYRTGYRDNNHLGSAVTLLKTPSNTPYFFNFHVPGSLNNPSKGHTTIIGGNGSGKTVAMAFLDAQLSRYGGRTFVFDRDHGLEIYLRACGGYYATLSPDNSDEIHFNPFQLPDIAANRKFCREWMAQLVKEENESSLPADIVSAIAECVDYVYEALPQSDRCLSNAVKLLPIHFARWPHLRRWLRSNGEFPEGEYAYLFDNVSDDFQMHNKMGFDLTHFLDVEPKQVLAALTMYLFHRLEQSFDGRLVTVLLDEGWQYLDNDYWIKKLRKWLPTLRKLNCHLVLATQSPSSVVDSSIRNMILDNVATSIYFSNPQAKREHYQNGFNLTEREFLTIKESSPEHHYFLLKQEHESCLCQLDLTGIADLLPIFSANRKSIVLLNKLREQYGDNPEQWLLPFRHEVQK